MDRIAGLPSWAFLRWALAQWSLASAFKVAFRTSKLSKVGLLLMQISAVGFCVAGAFSNACDLVAPQVLHTEQFNLDLFISWPAWSLFS